MKEVLVICGFIFVCLVVGVVAEYFYLKFKWKKSGKPMSYEEGEE